jgi:hypothetical protein
MEVHLHLNPQKTPNPRAAPPPRPPDRPMLPLKLRYASAIVLQIVRKKLQLVLEKSGVAFAGRKKPVRSAGRKSTG